MEHGQIIVWCIKLVLGGIAAFLAIMLWSKSRAASWMCLVASVLISYAGIIFDMMLSLGIITAKIIVFGAPLATLIFTIVPSIFLIAALILIIKDVA